MEYTKITKTQFRDEYNVVKILTDKIEIMKQLETFNSNNQAVAFGIKKAPRDTTPDWFKDFEKRIDEKFLKIEKRLDNIETRLDKHDEMFREHGWMK